MTSAAAVRTPLTRLRIGAARVADMAATPLVPADFLDLFGPLRSAVALRARIVSIIPETPDAATIVLRPGRGWRGHFPGQYLRVGVDIDGVRRWRAYSITCPPGLPGGRLSITVAAVADGLVSNHLVRDARPGTVVAP